MIFCCFVDIYCNKMFKFTLLVCPDHDHKNGLRVYKINKPYRVIFPLTRNNKANHLADV